MLRRLALLVVLAGLPGSAVAQQKAPVPDANTGPELLPPRPLQSPKKCRKERLETVKVDALINSAGVPVQYYFLSALGDDADQIALDTIGADRFVPAHKDGEPVQSHNEIAVDMDLCAETYTRRDGTKGAHLSLAASPRQRILETDADAAEFPVPPPDLSRPYHSGGGVSTPVALIYPEARYTTEARKAHIEGICLIKLIVDQHGMPVNPEMTKPLGMGLDENALEAVRNYRFKPAMRQGRIAVPVIITVEVNYRLYKRPS